MYPLVYDGVQMFKELKDELANLHDAYDSDEHERQKEVPYVGKRLGRLIVKFLPTALAGEGRTLLLELIDKKQLGSESKVIEETVRLVQMAHTAFPVSTAAKGLNKKDKRAVAAAASSQFKGTPGGTQTSGGAPYELPNGQWCSK
eukprot:415822-Pleurochrysis_carterae.AAC.1